MNRATLPLCDPEDLTREEPTWCQCSARRTSSRQGPPDPVGEDARLVNDLAIYGVGLAKRDRTLARLEKLLDEYRKQPATFACTLVPRRAPGTPRSGCDAT